MLPMTLLLPGAAFLAYKAWTSKHPGDPATHAPPSGLVGPPRSAAPVNRSAQILAELQHGGGVSMARPVVPGMGTMATSLLSHPFYIGRPPPMAPSPANIPGVPAGVGPILATAAQAIPPSAFQAAGQAAGKGLGGLFSSWGDSSSSDDEQTPVDEVDTSQAETISANDTPVPDTSGDTGSTDWGGDGGTEFA